MLCHLCLGPCWGARMPLLAVSFHFCFLLLYILLCMYVGLSPVPVFPVIMYHPFSHLREEGHTSCWGLLVGISPTFLVGARDSCLNGVMS